MTFQEFLMAAVLELLKSAEIIVPLTVIVLSFVPEKFKQLTEGIISVLSAKATEKLEARTIQAVKDAVDLAEQVGTSNKEKLFLAATHVTKRTGLDTLEAQHRVEAEVRRMTNHKPMAVAVPSSPAKLPVVHLE